MPAATLTQKQTVEIESYDVPDLRLVVGLGSAALHELTIDEGQLLFLISRGARLTEAASLLSASVEEIKDTKLSIMERFNAPDMASAVNRAILHKALPIEVQHDPSIRLTGKERKIMRLIAAGKSNSIVAQHFAKNNNAIIASNRRLFEKLGVNGRPQLVRRGHELGILK